MHRLLARAALAATLFAGCSGTMAATALSVAQSKIVATQVAALKHPEERQMASAWSDAKKVAEFICQPLARQALQTQVKGTDRVFLGTDDASTLSLDGNRVLTGTGSSRAGSDWKDFSFECRLDPDSGKATSFIATMKPVAP